MQPAEEQTLWRLLCNLFNIGRQQPKYMPPLGSDPTPPSLKKKGGFFFFFLHPQSTWHSAPPQVTVQMSLAAGFDYFQLGAAPGGETSQGFLDFVKASTADYSV